MNNKNKNVPYNNLKNRKHTPQKVLDLLWAIRNHDKFYFDTYGVLWIKELLKESSKTK